MGLTYVWCFGHYFLNLVFFLKYWPLIVCFYVKWFFSDKLLDLSGHVIVHALNSKKYDRSPIWQEPITQSLHLPYILESTFARIFFIFRTVFTPGELKFPAKAWCFHCFHWEMKAPGDGLLNMIIEVTRRKRTRKLSVFRPNSLPYLVICRSKRGFGKCFILLSLFSIFA